MLADPGEGDMLAVLEKSARIFLARDARVESDPDAVPIRDELFTVLPEIKDGQMTTPTEPGWGGELNEKTARAHAWSG